MEIASKDSQGEFWRARLPLGVPKPGCFKPGCLQFSRSLALFCALLCSFADLQLLSCVTILAASCKVPKPRPDKSAEKVLRPSSLCISNTEARRPKHFFGTFFGTPFGAGTFQSTFSALLSGRGFGTSVAGRQDCNSREH